MLPMRATRRLLRRALSRVASSGVLRRIRSMRGSSNAVAPEAAKQGNYHKMVDGEMLAKMRAKYSKDTLDVGDKAAGPQTLGDAPAADAASTAAANRNHAQARQARVPPMAACVVYARRDSRQLEPSLRWLR